MRGKNQSRITRNQTQTDHYNAYNKNMPNNNICKVISILRNRP